MEHQKTAARWTGRYIVSAFLETIGQALVLCVPFVLIAMPFVFDSAGYRFNPFFYAFWLAAVGLPTWALGVVVRPRILRPDFVNSIMLYQEDQT
ncbi:MAG TPA: hypothetical protein PLD03_06690 [Thiomonas arsenitoxydans]|uniref:Uncharacterized protein n=2 Tax=Thiomonas TaxID=32012 RepID=A0A8I1MYF0_THIA3|nr:MULTISPECIES: hypothetical protein [Thiomonas]CQR44751.1 conserved hypothetical protein [Thiomonas sp. CB3]SCC91937.1 conserved hypothetical protein [Thiomonas sp. X19]VDY10920.1 conserved protein of unknown function [Thiomonas sp. Sup16B3]VDY14040.1 conserved protein of unknown function [Thiomonas sp. OC7]MBN8744598.1 hypothetical protein [Thiomonas arsenitoxydans]